jgi:hypothetical protein
LRLCGCESVEPCFSVEIANWQTGAPIGPADGVTAHVVREEQYTDTPTSIAQATPDADGFAVFDAIPLQAGDRFFVMLDGGGEWSVTSAGPFEYDLPETCIRLPAVRADVGDLLREEAGVEGEAVIVELRGACGQLAEGVTLATDPQATVGYVTGDLSGIGDAPATTSASAAVTTPARYCSATCENLGCDCSDPSCGTAVARGGIANGFLFAQMRCDAP